MTLSGEHTEYGWFTLNGAAKAVRWDSNRAALRELDHRLRQGIGCPVIGSAPVHNTGCCDAGADV
ncbi:hypothetical protein [Amycolatopsis sp. NPDC001319]|uniref:hypothetical protein n=1 Tax=unclassified Amycolatopsis TaxID=2618356 RepID=UPI00369FD1F6